LPQPRSNRGYRPEQLITQFQAHGQLQSGHAAVQQVYASHE
jgi:hypothetical protein